MLWSVQNFCSMSAELQLNLKWGATLATGDISTVQKLAKRGALVKTSSCARCKCKKYSQSAERKLSLSVHSSRHIICVHCTCSIVINVYWWYICTFTQYLVQKEALWWRHQPCRFCSRGWGGGQRRKYAGSISWTHVVCFEDWRKYWVWVRILALESKCFSPS